MSQFVYGKNTVIQLLKSGRDFRKLLIAKDSKNQEIIDLAKRQNQKITFVSRKELDALTKENHQGVYGEIEDFRTYTLEDLLESIPQGKLPLLVMLDSLEDPHNLGAILRTCDAVEVDGVIIRKNRSVSLNATVAKVSCGAIDTVKVAEVTNLNETLKTLKKQGYWVCGADNNQALDYRAVDYNMPLVLVIGSEGAGISHLVQKSLDYSVVLPMKGQITSLNASVATGIMLYEIFSQRHPLENGVSYGSSKGKGTGKTVPAGE